MKRVLLFVATNLAVMVVLSIAVHLLGLNRWLDANGINYGALLLMCAIFGFGGAFISLLLSKPMAKWGVRAKTITGAEGPTERWLVDEVSRLAAQAGLRAPEVAYYEGAPNAFATGAFRNSALVAVSSGLLHAMPRDQVRAVLAHEVAHIANGDMQTMGLLQGVMNTFVMFAARVVGTIVDKAVFKSEEARGPGFFLTVIVLELLFGILAALVVMAFSRHREYRADWAAAELLGTARPMQAALNTLRLASRSDLPKTVAAFGISGAPGLLRLLSSHPPLQARLEALQAFGR
jgi:heat shock protein HtpX